MVPQPPAGMEVTFGSRINRRGQIAISRVTSVAEEGVLVLSPQWLTGDLTGDCQVSFSDLAVLLSHFGSGPEDFPAGDTDGDGDVDLGDLALLLSHFGQ